MDWEMEREADNERPGGKWGLFGEVIVPDDGWKRGGGVRFGASLKCLETETDSRVTHFDQNSRMTG